ncbi:MAG: hypothetical protein CfClM3_1351 [Methanobrevibacter sp. CfCl-M3]
MLVIAILAISVTGFSVNSVCAASGWQGSYDHWIIPTENEWNVTLDHCNDPLFHQRLYDVNTGEEVSDGGKPDVIDRTHLYHSLVYTCTIDAAWYNQCILIPFYAGGNIEIHSAILGGHKNSWADVTINHWSNWQIGRDTQGTGEYSLPQEAWNNLP